MNEEKTLCRDERHIGMASQLNWTARPGPVGSIASGLASGTVTASRGRAGADPGEPGRSCLGKTEQARQC